MDFGFISMSGVSFCGCSPCRDPNLWLVKCRMGEEKATAISLMRKFIAYQFQDEVRDPFCTICGHSMHFQFGWLSVANQKPQI